jgi:hypothetical protein
MAELVVDVADVLARAGCTPAVLDVVRERIRQQTEEGWTPGHDDEHEDGALAAASACYAHTAQFSLRPQNRDQPLPQLDIDPIVTALWPFDEVWFKPKNPRRDLVRAAALIIAEIERIDRADTAWRGS